MKYTVLGLVICLASIISCSSEKEIIAPTPQIDLTNIKDSAYFLIKWQGKEYFLRENPAKKIQVNTGGKGKLPDGRYTYMSDFGKYDYSNVERIHFGITTPLPSQLLSNFLKVVSVGKKDVLNSDNQLPIFAVLFEQKNMNIQKIYAGGLKGEDQYFEILESRNLQEERGEPSLILVKFRFKYKMYEQGKTQATDTMEGEVQTHLKYAYIDE